MINQVRVRFAPSPTGHLHVGGARTALFNWLFARHNNGVFVLRIEDTDAERSKDIYTKAIIDGLKWLGLDWDEGPEAGGAHGPYYQTQRMPSYREGIETLVSQGKVYHCFCKPETLARMREDQAAAKQEIKYDGRCRGLAPEEVQKRCQAGEAFVLRLRVDEKEAVTWDDLTKGPLSFSPDLLDDLVVVKSDGFPTYNFAVVMDDVGMAITHVIRGEDHISNTPKQILIYRALGAKAPLFSHIPMILGADRSRLSKRHGATSVIDYKDLGYEPEALRNYLALLGWSPDNKEEILSREQLIEKFSLDRVSTHGAIFDLVKLGQINMEYIKKLSPDSLLDKVRPWLETQAGFPDGYTEQELKKIAWLYRERMKTFNEIESQVGWFFKDPVEFDAKGLEKARKTEGWADLISKLSVLLSQKTEFTATPLEAFLRAFAEENGKKAGEVIHLLRLALSGRTATPGMFELMEILGLERCQRRLKAFVQLP